MKTTGLRPLALARCTSSASRCVIVAMGSAALHARLELARACVDEQRLRGGLDRPTDQHADHATGVAVELVGGAGPAVAQVVEHPGAGHRLEVALLLAPG